MEAVRSILLPLTSKKWSNVKHAKLELFTIYDLLNQIIMRI